MVLYRPVGLRELELIAESGFRAFPPRLEHQPIFYPVLNLEYAVQIAREWNARDEASGYIGFVTRFELEDEFARKFPARTVGARGHQELWVPAGELPELNRHIRGVIEVEAAFPGPHFGGELDATTRLPIRSVPTWVVWRQDDNGNRFEVQAGLPEDQARRLVAELEARGHKQAYWAAQATSSSVDEN
jgi:hypothetical protein